MRVLFVKTSSMGDVVHALPAVSDLLSLRPGLQIDWLVEAPFAAIPQMHPGVRRVLVLRWRKWRGQLFSADSWRAMRALRESMQKEHYDLVLDLQGLVKSAMWSRQAGAPVAGYDRRSAREPLASWLYQRTATVPRELQAIERCRRLVAAHFGYALPSTAPDFQLRVPPTGWSPGRRYAVLIPNASRPEKAWPEKRWVAVGRRLQALGSTPVVLWGGDAEQTLAERIAAGCEGDVPPFLKVGEMASVLAGATQVVGLDTGFSHLGAALGRPTLGIYCDHEPGLAGITGRGPVASLGGKGKVPALADVLSVVERHAALPI